MVQANPTVHWHGIEVIA